MYGMKLNQLSHLSRAQRRFGHNILFSFGGMTPTALHSVEWADTQASPSPGPAPGPALLGFLEGRPKTVGGKVWSCSSWMHPGVGWGATEDPLEVPGPLLSFPFTLRAWPESARTLCSSGGLLLASQESWLFHCTPKEHTPGLNRGWEYWGA